MSVSDSTIYVIGIEHSYLLDDIYESLEEAIEDIKSPDKQYVIDNHTVQVYKTTMRELHRFYKEFTLHSVANPKKYLDVHLTQVYPDPFNDYTINELAVEGLKWYNNGHYDNSPLMRPIYKILKRIYELSNQ